MIDDGRLLNSAMVIMIVSRTILGQAQRLNVNKMQMKQEQDTAKDRQQRSREDEQVNENHLRMDVV